MAEISHNPNVVSFLRKESFDCTDEMWLFDCLQRKETATGQVFKAAVREFRTKFKEARSLLKGIPWTTPLAPRLDVITEPVKQDSIVGNKFGGIPDLLKLYSDLSYIRPWKNGYRIYPPTIDAFIDRNWPLCSCCHLPMMFLGQIDLTLWMAAIHQCTYHELVYQGKKETRIDWRYSFLGQNRFAGNISPNYESWAYFWCCPDNHIQTFASDAFCKIAHLEVPESINKLNEQMRAAERSFEKKHGLKKDKPKKRKKQKPSPPWTLEKFRAAIKPRMQKPKHATFDAIPLQKVVAVELRFDVDDPERYSRQDYKTEDKLEKIQDAHPDIFSTKGEFGIFGKPISQQTEPRYVCINGYPAPHRMSPLLQWHNPHQDVTHQMYGCISCSTDYDASIFAKMDNSCT